MEDELYVFNYYLYNIHVIERNIRYIITLLMYHPYLVLTIFHCIHVRRLVPQVHLYPGMNMFVAVVTGILVHNMVYVIPLF